MLLKWSVQPRVGDIPVILENSGPGFISHGISMEYQTCEIFYEDSMGLHGYSIESREVFAQSVM